MKCDHFINCHFVVFTCTPVCKLAQTIWIWKSDIGISQSSVKRIGKSAVCTNRCFPAVLWAIMLYSLSVEPISSNTLTFTAQCLWCSSEVFSLHCGQNCKYLIIWLKRLCRFIQKCNVCCYLIVIAILLKWYCYCCWAITVEINDIAEISAVLPVLSGFY